MTNIIDLLEHIISVINYELKTANLFDIFIIGIIEFAVFYYFSTFAKNIILKTLIFAFGLKALFQTVQDNSILTEPLVFATLGLIAPHFDIFSKLLQSIKNILQALYERILVIYNYISIPFKWIISFILKIKTFFTKTRQNYTNQNHSNYKEKSYKNYYQENSSNSHKQQESSQSYEYQKKSYKEKHKQSSNRNKQNYQKQKESQKQSYQQNKKQKSRQKTSEENHKQKQSQHNYSNSKQKTTSRWDSTNAYEVLGIKNNATQKEIKKAFRKLAKIYHPDLTQDKKEEHKIIFQKINRAYNILKE